MQSSAPATAFAPLAPDAARRLLTELRRHRVAITGIKAPQPSRGGAAGGYGAPSPWRRRPSQQHPRCSWPRPGCSPSTFLYELPSEELPAGSSGAGWEFQVGGLFRNVEVGGAGGTHGSHGAGCRTRRGAGRGADRGAGRRARGQRGPRGGGVDPPIESVTAHAPVTGTYDDAFALARSGTLLAVILLDGDLA